MSFLPNIFKKKKQFLQHEVGTLNNNSNPYQDRNYDGIPDYLQRPELSSMVKENKDLNQWEADNQKEIEELCMQWKGYQFDMNKQSYIPTSPPIMNDIGIEEIKSVMLSIVNKNTINTYMEEDDTLRILHNTLMSLSSWLMCNRNIINIRVVDLTPVVISIHNYCKGVITQSIRGGHRHHVTQRTKLTGMTSEVSNNNKNFLGG
jgi:hypothetical protein